MNELNNYYLFALFYRKRFKLITIIKNYQYCSRAKLYLKPSFNGRLSRHDAAPNKWK